MNETLSACINTTLQRRGRRNALVAGHTVLSGYELRQRSLELTSTIRALGVKPGDTVGVMVDRSTESVIAMLAVLNLGCAYLPLDATAPEPWLRHLLILSRARLLVHPVGEYATAWRLAEVPEYGVVSTQVGDPSPASGPIMDWVRDDVGQEPRLAYVMGTSGTTGPPKAVPVSEANLLRYCEAFAARVGGAPTLTGMRMASVTTLAADLGNTMIFPALLFGGELHLIPEDASRDPLRFAEYSREHEIDALKVVPTHLRALLEGGPAVLPNRLLIVGGEPFGLDLLERLEACAPRCTVFNHYGPTETTVGVAMHHVETSFGSANRLRDEGFRTVPVGTALGATQLRIVDEQLEPCEPGRIGELVIGGPCVAHGYLGHQSEAAHPFTTARWSRGKVVFRSGDRARLSPRGEIELFGRTDRQLKVRGHRVEAAGVEEELRAHPAVHDAHVGMRRLGDLGPALIAWVHVDDNVGELALREFLRTRLPTPMVPSRIVVLEELPRTANGKVDQRVLPNPPRGQHAQRDPGTGEDAVCQIFAEVLMLPPDAVRDDFFRLGGHSLAALRVVGRLRHECGLDVSVEDFFADARPAAIVRGAQPVKRAAPSSEPNRLPSPISPQVRALWTHLQLSPHDTAYEVPLRLTVVGPFDAERIRLALTEFASRHQVLRTRFIVEDRELLPVVDPTPDATLRFDEDLALDLEMGPLLRAIVTQVGHHEHLVDLVIHHIAFDGVSQSVLVRELAAMLSDELLPPPVVIRPQAPVPGGAQRCPLGDGARAQLGLAPSQPFSDAPARCHASHLPTGLWDLIQSRAIELNTTPFALVTAAWALVLSRQDSETAVTIGTPADLRDGSAEGQVVGYHVNVVVLEVDVRPDDTVRELVSRTRHAVGRALASRDWPYADRVADQRAATGTPPTRTLLTIQRLERVVGTKVEIRQEAVNSPRPMFGVDVCVLVDDEGALVQMHHREDVCPEWRARCLADQFRYVLEQTVSDPDTPVSCVDVLPSAWTERLMKWSRGQTVRPLKRWGAHGFLVRAQEDPSANALVWPGGEWTRSRLATEIKCTFRTLLDRGIGPGHAVAINVPPSPAAIVAWHAAHLVGAAVLALDPAWPEPRRRAAAELAQATVLIDSPDGTSTVVKGRAAEQAQHPHDLAYLVLTSGSTGTPKMVAIQQRALVNELSWFAAEFPIAKQDRVLAHTSPGFDVAVWELLGPLAWGATLVFPSVGRRCDVPHLAEVIRKHAVTVVQTVPSLLDALLDEADLGLGQLRLILCGGEEMPPSLASAVADRLPGATFINVYGPSETTIDATFCRVDREVTLGRKVPLGRPIAGVRAYVLDDRLRLQPPGAFGQLAIGGNAVGLGYLNDPAATARCFVPDPFVSESGARLYLTGDRARWNGAGQLEFGGRQDNQVKVRGNRIELEEVEAALRALPTIEDAVVHPLAGGAREARLIALVVPAKGAHLTIHDLHARVAQVLPAYMVPSAFGLVESLPRLSSGKVARDALPLDVLEAPATKDQWRTEMEERVSRVWSELLGHHMLERDLPFFASGGTSLLIPTLRLRLSQEMGATLSVPELFEYSTIRTQAAALERRHAGTEAQTSTVSGRGALRRQALAARRNRGSE